MNITGQSSATLQGRGQWVTATSYLANDVVTNIGDVFVCILAHTAGSGSEPGVGASTATYWLKYSDGITPDQALALVGTSGTPGTANKYVTNDDSRNTDARTPSAHNQAATTITAGTFPAGAFGFTDTQTLPLYSSQVVPTFVAGTVTLSAAQCANTIVNNYNQSQSSTIVLPAAAAGMALIVIVSTTGYALFIDPNASEVVYLDGTALTGGWRVTCTTPAVGNCIALFAFKSGAASYAWFANSIGGLWVSAGS